MPKKKVTNKPVVCNSSGSSEFKPGSKPYYEYDGVMLNANVPWDEILSELIATGSSRQEIALQIGVDVDVLKEIESCLFDNLPFRAGARMLTMHCKTHPQFYSN